MTIMTVAKFTPQQLHAAATALFVTPLPQDQQGWRKLMEEHGPEIQTIMYPLSVVELDVPWDPSKIAKVRETAFKMGLFGNADYFETIPSRLPSQLVNGQPKLVMTRLVEHLDDDHYDTFLIQPEDGELIHLRRFGDFNACGHNWTIKGTFVEMGATELDEPTEILNPELILFSEEYIRISQITETLIKTEAIARVTLGCVRFSTNLQDIVLSYLSYPSEAEKSQAKTKRLELQRSVKCGCCFG